MSSPDLLIFGGAFDPPHAAHLAAAAAALRAFPKAKLWFVPGVAPATATGGGKQPIASFADRIAMCRLLCASIGPRALVSDIEGTLPTPNYTITTLKAIAERHPEERLGLLIGQDQVAAFAKWRAPGAILKLASLVILARRAPNDGRDGALLTADLSRLYAAFPDIEPKTHVLAGIDAGPAASRRIRAELMGASGGLPKDHEARDWLSPEVASYIRSHSLYEARSAP